jgi:hypothetical protein
VICPVCKEQGLRSKVFLSGGGIATAMASHQHYDEDGMLHLHDPNSFTEHLLCSEDHEWIRVTHKSCWCGWSRGGESIRILGPTAT